jgi:vitamin B12 transporter
MKREIKIFVAGLITLAFLTPNKTLAQQDSLLSRQLSEVVITATKFPKTQGETGKVLTVIDQEMIMRSQGKDLAQLLNEQVGLVINGANSNPGKDKSVYMRGAKNEYTLILIDGVPVNDPSGVSGGAYDLRLLSLDQVERIEILKGSQSTLYGSDAVAGVINIITKRDGSKPVEFLGSLSYGSYNSWNGTAVVSGKTKHFDYNAGYTTFKTDGISEAKENVGGDFDKDDARQESLHANLGFKPTDRLAFKPFVRFTKFDGKYDGGPFADDILNKYEATLLNTGAQANYSLKKGSLNMQYAYNQSDRVFDGTYGKSTYTGKFNHAEVFMNYELTKQLQLLGGVALQDLKMLDTTSVEKDPSALLASPYVSVFMNTKNFSVELGGRYNHHTQFGQNFTYSFNPSYRWQNGLKAFINLSTGFKAPTLYQLYGQYGANPDLKPERSQNAEAGVQWVSQSKKIEGRMVFFARRIEDVIVYAYPTNVNLNEQNDRGVEWELTVTPTPKLTLKAFYAYVTGDVTTTTNNKDTTFNNLIRRPKNSFGLNAGYRLNQKWYSSLNLQSFGKREDLYFDESTFTSQQVTLTSYVLLDVYVEYSLPKPSLTLFLQGKNLLNQNYEEVYGYSTMGINMQGGVKIKL